MPLGLLDLFKYLLIALIWLFFIRVLRAVWVQVKTPVSRDETSSLARDSRGPSRNNQGFGSRRDSAKKTNSMEPAIEASTKNSRGASTEVLGMGLKLVDGHTGKTYEIRDVGTIGRSSGCTIPLGNDEFGSAVHARVFSHDGGYLVEDLGSTNGTWVNDTRIAAATRLRHGDKITIGRSTLEVVG